MDTSELKSAIFSTFNFDTKFALCRDKHQHIPSLKIPTCQKENPPLINTINVPVSVHMEYDYSKDEVHTLTEKGNC